MRSNEHSRESVINPWVSLSDAVLGFMIIIFLLFSLNVIKLKQMAEYVQTAIDDKNELLEMMGKAGLSEFITGKDISLQGNKNRDIWDSGDTQWNEIKGDYANKIAKFGSVLKNFMDKESRKQTYTILIVGHASADGDESETDRLALERAETIRDYFKRTFFTTSNNRQIGKNGFVVEPQDVYKIYATGVGEKQLRDTKNPLSYTNRFIEIKLIPDFLKFSQ